jgi:ubiquitin-like-conjugating enzyme ATG3
MFNSLHSAFHAARQALRPIATESSFVTTGVLTPEEFVYAGDSLVQAFRTWSWSHGPVVREYLPPDKQFLILRGAVCDQRANALAAEAAAVKETEEEGDWVASGNSAQATEEYTDLDSLNDYMDPSVLAIAAADTGVQAVNQNRRIYKLIIVYDKYYRTPRVYLQGARLNGDLLSPLEMMDDIVQDYAGKTATMEHHPHAPDDGMYVSIHPCRHADTMKRLLQMCSAGTAPTIGSYMMYFIKFITSMIPTIEYDYTASVSTA